MEIRTVTDNDIAKISAFASDVFIDYYNDLIGNRQAVYMAELFLSEEAIRKLIADGAIFRTVCEDDEIIAFTEYIREAERVFLSKLYVRKDRRGEGIGKLLFDDCVDYARKNGLKSIYLTVNKGNTPSFNIYDHLGFKVIDAVVNDIGQGYVMDDYVMEYTLKDE